MISDDDDDEERRALKRAIARAIEDAKKLPELGAAARIIAGGYGLLLLTCDACFWFAIGEDLEVRAGDWDRIATDPATEAERKTALEAAAAAFPELKALLRN